MNLNLLENTNFEDESGKYQTRIKLRKSQFVTHVVLGF